MWRDIPPEGAFSSLSTVQVKIPQVKCLTPETAQTLDSGIFAYLCVHLYDGERGVKGESLEMEPKPYTPHNLSRRSGGLF